MIIHTIRTVGPGSYNHVCSLVNVSISQVLDKLDEIVHIQLGGGDSELGVRSIRFLINQCWINQVL